MAFNYADPTKVQDSDIIGAVTSGVYTGIQALQTTYGTMGFFAKILIAPGYSQNADVATAESRSRTRFARSRWSIHLHRRRWQAQSAIVARPETLSTPRATAPSFAIPRRPSMTQGLFLRE